MCTCVRRVKVARDEREDHSDSECNRPLLQQPSVVTVTEVSLPSP